MTAFVDETTHESSNVSEMTMSNRTSSEAQSLELRLLRPSGNIWESSQLFIRVLQFCSRGVLRLSVARQFLAWRRLLAWRLLSSVRLVLFWLHGNHDARIACI